MRGCLGFSRAIIAIMALDLYPIPSNTLGSAMWREFFNGDRHWQPVFGRKGVPKNLAVLGGRRSAKTRWIFDVSARACFNGQQVTYVAAKQQLGEAAFEENVTRIVEMAPGALRADITAKHILQYKNDEVGKVGSIKLISALGKQTARGMRADILAIDEAQSIKQEVYARARPILLSKGGRTIFGLTPPETPAEHLCAQWLFKMFSECLWSPMDSSGPAVSYDLATGWHPRAFGFNPAHPSFLFVYAPTSPVDLGWVRSLEAGEGASAMSVPDWIRVGEQALEEEKEELGQEAYDRELGLAWRLSASERVLAGAENCFTNEAEFRPGVPIIVSVDIGGGVAKTVALFAHAIEQPDGSTKLIVFDEFSSTSRRTETEWVELITEYCLDKEYEPPFQFGYRTARPNAYGLPDTIVPDPRALGWASAVRSAGIEYGKLGNVNIEPSVNKIRNYARKGWLKVHPRCTEMNKSVVSWARGADGIPADINNDAGDALRYLTMWVDRTANISEAAGRELMEAREKVVGTPFLTSL